MTPIHFTIQPTRFPNKNAEMSYIRILVPQLSTRTSQIAVCAARGRFSTVCADVFARLAAGSISSSAPNGFYRIASGSHPNPHPLSRSARRRPEGGRDA
jgi:hypothetical protein